MIREMDIVVNERNGGMMEVIIGMVDTFLKNKSNWLQTFIEDNRFEEIIEEKITMSIVNYRDDLYQIRILDENVNLKYKFWYSGDLVNKDYNYKQLEMTEPAEPINERQ